MPSIAVAHGVDYVATASASYPKDLFEKVTKALAMAGPSYIQVHTPCVGGWGFPSGKTVEVGRLAVESGLVPLFEMERGQLVRVQKIRKKIPVAEYLKVQKRFSHLFMGDEGKGELETVQTIADQNIERYGLLRPDEEMGSPA